MTVDVFEPTALGKYTLVRRLTGTPSGPRTINGVAVDGGNGDIYVLEGERGDRPVQLRGRLSGPSDRRGHTSRRIRQDWRGLAVDPATHDVYVGDEGRQGTFVDVFGPSIVVPDVTTEAASSMKARSATLNGTVNPDEAGAATCRFEWGTSTAFGKIAPCEPEGVANGDSPVAVHAALSALPPDTTYYYRLQASNANGTNPGEAFQDQEFTTPGPGIHEESASTVTSLRDAGCHDRPRQRAHDLLLPVRHEHRLRDDRARRARSRASARARAIWP